MKILLAVSGGIDSMYMAERALEGALFCHVQAEFGVAHCNFHLRGAESDGDEEFVRDWCKRKGIPFHSTGFDTDEYAEKKAISIEMAARELRYSWFDAICREFGYDAVAVAHNANDNAETFILNLTRGTGGRGLRGMQADSVQGGLRILRPMLEISREQIVAWMREHALSWREDRTNADTVYRRNAIRHNILPQMESLNPSILEAMSRTMKHISEENDIADEWFRSQAAGIVLSDDGGDIPLCAITDCSHQRYLLYRLLERYAFSEQTLDSLLGLIGSGRTFSGKEFQSPSHSLTTSSSALSIRPRNNGERNETALVIKQCGEYSFGGRTLLIEDIDRNELGELKQEKGCLIFDAETLCFPFTLRRWEDGDRMQPFGMEGRWKKLSDIFTDLKWTLEQKSRAIIIEKDGIVAALAGERSSQRFAVTPSTRRVLRIVLD